MYYQYDQNCIFGAKFDPEIYKRDILLIGSLGIQGFPDRPTKSIQNVSKKFYP